MEQVLDIYHDGLVKTMRDINSTRKIKICELINGKPSDRVLYNVASKDAYQYWGLSARQAGDDAYYETKGALLNKHDTELRLEELKTQTHAWEENGPPEACLK